VEEEEARHQFSIKIMTEPFDPFSYEDEPSNAATDDTSKTTNTTNKRRQQRPTGQAEDTSANKRLPPRLQVKISHHEEVSSKSIEERSESMGGSLSRLFITGKIMVSI
jgi:hypothetical protein